MTEDPNELALIKFLNEVQDRIHRELEVAFELHHPKHEEKKKK